MRDTVKQVFRKPRRHALATAVLLALFTVVSHAYQTADSASPLFASPTALARWTIMFVALAAVAYVGISVLFFLLDRANHGAQEADISFRTVLRRHFLLFFLVVYICWMPWIVSHYPGLMRDDTVRQMMQTYALEPYSNANPLFDTWVFGLFWQLGDTLGNRALGLYLFGFVQAALTAGSFSFALCYLEKIRAPKFVIAASLAAISLLCIFPQAAMSMSKDSFNGCPFILFFVLVAELCRSKGNVIKRADFLVALTLSTILLVATKRSMLYVALLVFASVFVFVQGRRVRAATTFTIIIAASAAFSSVMMPSVMRNDAEKSLRSEPPAADATFVLIPLQQTGRLLAEGGDIPPKERAALERYIDCDLTAETYNPRRADEVVQATKSGSTNEDRAAYLNAWASLGTKHPAEYTEPFVNQIFGWFSPFWKIAFGYDLSNDVFDKGHMDIWASHAPEGEAATRPLLEPLDTDLAALTPLQSLTEQWACWQYYTPGLISCGVWCTWIPLVAFAYTLRAGKRRTAVAFAVPAATLLSVLIGPMVLYWYAIPLFYIAPLLMGIASAPEPEIRRSLSNSVGKPCA